MTSQDNKPSVSSFLGLLWSRRDLVYLLSLLFPLIVYNLALKASSVASIPGLPLGFDVLKSDVYFNLGYALFWIGLFAVVRGRGTLRRIVVVLFHFTTVLVVIVTTSAHQYFEKTGSTLDYNILALWLPHPKEVAPVVASSGATHWVWLLLFAALFYAALGPLLVTRAVMRWRGWPEGTHGGSPETSFSRSFELRLVPLGLLFIAFGLGSLSLLIGVRSADNPAGTSMSFVRDPFVNLILTGAQESAQDAAFSGQHVENPAAHASLSQTQSAQKRNVVLIHLESTRAESTTPYNSQLQTMPFLNELAKSSLLAQNDYTTVPHTSKAVTSVNCSIEPHLVQPTTEAEQGGIPAPCLPSLLKEQGYTSVFFQSSTEDFEDFKGLVKNFGYEEYYPLESMSTQGFKQSNYFGYEDDIMLKPSQQWLETHKEQGSGQEPFVAEYLLGTGHHDYKCLGLRYGDENFSNEEPLNSYLNCLNYQDHFLENLINQYKSLGLYENTIFVIYGDHGEGFGEHGRFQHNDTIYEEGIKVPLVIHSPGLIRGGQRVEGLTNHTDILPTVLDLLGYKVQNGEYPGYSLVRPLPQDRSLNLSCWDSHACLASIKGSEKYIYNYGNQPDEVYDLSKDPQEKNNLASQYSKEELDQRREDLLKWRSGVEAEYAG